MILIRRKKHRYLICCILSATAAILGVLNPFLAALVIARIKHAAGYAKIIAILACLGGVKATRMYFRFSVGKLLGGNQRAPFNWLRRQIGNWFWWLEPLLQNWGWVGMAVNKFTRGSPLGQQLATGIIYYISDTATTVLAGVIYYYTENYALSFLPILALPIIITIPWITAKNQISSRSSALRGKLHVRNVRKRADAARQSGRLTR